MQSRRWSPYPNHIFLNIRPHLSTSHSREFFALLLRRLSPQADPLPFDLDV